MSDKKAPDDIKVLVRNKKARHDYTVEQTIEAGIQLRGSEVKSLREAHASISDAYAMARNGELWLMQLQINEYAWAHHFQHEPKRERKLLLHRREIDRLQSSDLACEGPVLSLRRRLGYRPTGYFIPKGNVPTRFAGITSEMWSHPPEGAAARRC